MYELKMIYREQSFLLEASVFGAAENIHAAVGRETNQYKTVIILPKH
jgi:hypothetical protein